MYCRYCGKTLSDDAKFCNSCGQSILIQHVEKKTEVHTVHNQKTELSLNQASAAPKKKRNKSKKPKIVIVALLVLILLGVSGFFARPYFKSFISALKSNGVNSKITKDLGEAYYKEPETKFVVKTNTWGYIPTNQVIIVLNEKVEKNEAEEIISSIDGEIVGEIEYLNLYQIEIDDATENELISLIDNLLLTEGVEGAFPNVTIESLDVEGVSCTPLKDPIFQEGSNSKHYEIIGMTEAWEIIRGSGIELNSVYVGVLDSAIYTGSTEFKGKVKLTGDTTDTPALDDEGKPEDGHLNHGTMVTHVIGADHENSGMVGVASVLGDKLNIDVKNLFDNQEGIVLAEKDDEDWTQGIYNQNHAYVIKALVYLKEQVESGATVINCSFGPEQPSESHQWISKAYERFFEKVHKKYPDVVFVAAAGNEGKADKSKGELNGNNYFPAGLSAPNLITVGALNNDGSRASFSNFAGEGAEVTLSAPGANMVLGIDLSGEEKDQTGKAVRASGTSFAAPQVTATIALLQAINPDLKAKQIKEILIETAGKGVTTGNQSIPIPGGMGAGVLRVDQAVLKVINDLRITQGLDPYEQDFLQNCSRIGLSAQGEDRKYKIVANISAVIDKNTDVKIEISGDHSLKGKSVQNVTKGNQATWDIEINDQEVFIKVTRLDSGGCAYLSLKPPMEPISEQDEPDQEVDKEEIPTDKGIEGKWRCIEMRYEYGSPEPPYHEYTLSCSGGTFELYVKYNTGETYTYVGTYAKRNEEDEYTLTIDSGDTTKDYWDKQDLLNAHNLEALYASISEDGELSLGTVSFRLIFSR